MASIDAQSPRRMGRPRKEAVAIPSAPLVPAPAVIRPYMGLKPPDEELLTTEEAAAITKLSTHWFKRKRWEGRGPPYRRRGRSVRYLKSELLAWFTEIRGDDFKGGD